MEREGKSLRKQKLALIRQILEVKRKEPLNFSKIRQLQQALDRLTSSC